MKVNFLPFLVILIAIVVGFSMFKSETKPITDAFKEEFLANSFDFPVGKPDGYGYYNAQKFGENNHLGDDWNGVGGGNTDYGDSIFSVANGQVIFAEDVVPAQSISNFDLSGVVEARSERFKIGIKGKPEL